MIASGQTLKLLQPVQPFCERTKHNGMTYGVGPAGYDVRIAQTIDLEPNGFTLASTLEKFVMPNFLVGIVHDKSTLARLGIALQNTVIEPGWSGFLTLEITNHSEKRVIITEGTPIAQIIFHMTDMHVENPYSGKYQDQQSGPVAAILEK
jgi:dCTP deaminase